MDERDLATALGRYWDARHTPAPLPPPDRALAGVIDALEADATVQPAPAFVAELARRLDQHQAAAHPALPPRPAPAPLAPTPPLAGRTRSVPAPARRYRLAPLVATAAMLLLTLAAAGGILLTIAGGFFNDDPPQLAAPIASPSHASATPVFLRIPRWGAAVTVLPVDAETAVKVIWTQQNDFETVPAGWDAASARPSTSGAVVLTLPATWPAASLAAGDEVEVITADYLIYRYRLAAPVIEENEPGNLLAGVATPATSPASIVLLGNDLTSDTVNQVPERRVVLRGTLVESLPLPVLARPPAAACTGPARPVADLDAVFDRLTDAQPTVTTIAGSGLTDGTSVPLERGRERGEPADAATIQAIIATETELVACLNAGDELRAYRLFTDAGLDSFFGYVMGPVLAEPYNFEPDFSELTQPATPIPDAFELALLDVSDAIIRPDGWAEATVWIGLVDTWQIMWDEHPDDPTVSPASYFIPVVAPTRQVLSPQPGGNYRIVAFGLAPSATNLPPPDDQDDR